MLPSLLRALPLAGALTLFSIAAAASQSPGIQPGDKLDVAVVFDGAPAPNLTIELHRITNTGAGMVAQGVTDQAGRFTFTLEPDPTAESNIFFATAEKSGIRYFGAPVHSGSPVPAEYPIEVFDTASTAPLPLRVPVRDVFLTALPDGAWEVNDWIRITNDNRVALVAGAGAPSFQVRIPEGATDFEVDEGSVQPSEVSRMGDRLLLLTPITPGTRDLFVRYRLPARPTNATFPIGEPTDTMNLYVQQPSHLSEVVGLPRLSPIDFEGQTYLRYTGNALEPASSVRLAWSGALSPPVNPVIAAVVVTILLLAAGAIVAARNRGAIGRA